MFWYSRNLSALMQSVFRLQVTLEEVGNLHPNQDVIKSFMVQSRGHKIVEFAEQHHPVQVS